MKHVAAFATVLFLLGHAAPGEPSLTIYNQAFAVVRDVVPVELKPGLNEISFSGMTAHAEPQSVIFRDPAGAPFSVLTQSYRNDAVSQEALLNQFEGKTIKFLVQRGEKEQVVEGKVIRGADARWLEKQRESHYNLPTSGSGFGLPIIEMEGELRFGLPGQPIFPKLGDDSIIRPTLTWRIQAEQPAKFNAELGYVSGGFQWLADYNVIAAEKGDQVEMIGLVSIANSSGTSFRDARVRLLAGEVSRLIKDDRHTALMANVALMPSREASPRGPRVTEKTFDEYHLYSLPDPVTLRDGETVQVEFVRAAGIKVQRVYIYDGVQMPNERDHPGMSGWDNPNYGTQSNKSVWVMQEFRNSEANQLGMPLPRGRIRFYRRDGTQLEFTGENIIAHTAKDEVLRLYTGDAFDLTGERLRTDYRSDDTRGWIEETFTLKLRNQKKETVEMRAVEHLYRSTNWEILEKSNAFLKTDAQTIEFRVQVKPAEEKTITYKVRYTR